MALFNFDKSGSIEGKQDGPPKSVCNKMWPKCGAFRRENKYE